MADLSLALAEACREVDGLCTLLTAPVADNLERSTAVLEALAAAMESGWREWAPIRPDAKAVAEARRLRSALRCASGLMESSAEYFAGWNQVLGAMSGGYQPDGAPAPVARNGRLCLTG